MNRQYRHYYGHSWMYPSPTYKSNSKNVSLNKAPLWIFTFHVVHIGFQNHQQCTPWNISSRPCDPPLGNVPKKNGWFFCWRECPQRMHLYTFQVLGKNRNICPDVFSVFFFGKNNQPSMNHGWLAWVPWRFRVEVQQHLKLADSSIQRLGLLQVSLSNGAISSVGGWWVGLVVVVFFFFMRSPHKMFSYTRHMVILGVSNKSGTPKWMVWNGKPY